TDRSCLSCDKVGYADEVLDQWLAVGATAAIPELFGPLTVGEGEDQKPEFLEVAPDPRLDRCATYHPGTRLHARWQDDDTLVLSGAASWPRMGSDDPVPSPWFEATPGPTTAGTYRLVP